MFARHSRGPTHFAFAAASSVAAHLDHGGRGAGVKGDKCLRVLRQVGNGCHLSPAGLDQFGERQLEVCRSRVWVHVCGRMRTDAFDDHHISATRWHSRSRASSQNSTKHATSTQSLSAAPVHLCNRCCSTCRRARGAGHRLLHGRPAPNPAKSNWQEERVACCWDSHTKLALDRVAQASRMLVQQPQRYGIAVTLAV